MAGNFHPNYFREVSAGNLWALKHIPLFAKWNRFLLFWGLSDAFHASLHMDPAWSQPEISLNAENHAFRQRLIDHAREQLDGDEALLKKVIPNYPPGASACCGMTDGSRC